jgi:NAD kinase
MLRAGIAVVTRKTRYRGLLERYATRGQAKFKLKQARLQEKARARPNVTLRQAALDEVEAEQDFIEYEAEDQAYQRTLEQLEQDLDLGLPLLFVDRQYLPTFNFRNCNVVVVVGQDGLVANTAKYVGDLPIVAVNPDPQRIDGILLPFKTRQARQAVRNTLDGKARLRWVTLAEASLDDGQRMLAFNDFFVGAASHVSARYTLRVQDRAEPQSSSGVLISTGAGSTGWLSSVFNMADGLDAWRGVEPRERLRLEWDDPRLVWAVREPFASKHSQASLVAGLLEQGQELIVESQMPEGGVIFSDGIEADFLQFTSGTIARLFASQQRARLVVG